MKLSPGGSFAPLRSPSVVYVSRRLHVAPYTRGTVYAWRRICMELYTHGAVYARSRIRMEPYMHGAVYAWSHILVVPAHSPCSQLASLAPWASLGLWNFSRALGSPQLTPLTSTLLPLLPACSPYFQLAPLALWASLGHGTSLRPQEAPSSLPACSPCSLSIPGSLELPSLPAGSSSLQLAPSWLSMANEQFNMYWDSHHLWVARG